MNASEKPFRISSLKLLLVGLVIGGLAGWFAGRHFGGTESAENTAASQGKAGSADQRGETRGRKTSGSPADRASPGSRPVSAGASKEFAVSVRSIFRETMEERRLAMFESMLEKLGHEHFGSVVSLIRENDLRGSDSGAEWSKLWAIWGRRDPAGAMQFLRSQDWSGWDPNAPAEARNRALVSWAQTDPDATRRFVEEGGELASGDRSMVYGLVRGWSDVDPQAAAEWVFKSGLGMSGEYKAVVDAIGRKGGHEALDAWFSGIDEGGAPTKDKSGFAQAIAEIKQEYEPEKAAAWVEKHLKEPWVAESEIVETTAHALAMRDPVEAMAWAQRTGIESASNIAMDTWCRQDVQAASDWLGENSQIPGFSSAASVLVHHLQRSDPAAARTWAENIPDQAVRERVLIKLQEN